MQREQLAVQRDQLIRVGVDLARSRDRYADLFDFSPTGFLVLDRQGILKDVNLTGARMLGAERKRLIDFPFVTFVVASQRRAFMDHLVHCRRDDQAHEVELDLKRRGGGVVPVHLTTKRGGAAAAAAGTTFFSAMPKCMLSCGPVT